MNRRMGMAMAAVVLVSGLPGLARADRLDQHLHHEMPSIIQKLKQKKCANVGVLRFRVHQAGRSATYEAPLSGSLTTRVENLLIINGGPDESRAVGVIRDATETASQMGVTRWAANPKDRADLFNLRYPRAWGSARVRPDGFLTGEVSLSKDLMKTTVVVQYIDRRDPLDTAILARLTFNTDRNILRDMGYSFAVQKRGGRTLLAMRAISRSPVVVEELPDEDDKKPDDKKPQDKKPDDKKPDDKKPDDKKPDDKKPDDKEEGPQPRPDEVTRPVSVGGVEVQMLVEGRPHAFRPHAGSADGTSWEVVCPPPGKPIQFRLRNNGSKRLAVVLRVNGVNTINEQKDAPERCGKWVLDPGKSALVKGYLMLGEATGGKNEVLPFAVLVGADAAKIRSEMGDRAGLIQVDVFQDGSDRDEITVTPRGLPPSKDKAVRASYVSLRDALLKSAGLKKQMVKTREVLGPDRTAPPTGYDRVKVIPLTNPQLVASVTIKVVPGSPAE